MLVLSLCPLDLAGVAASVPFWLAPAAWHCGSGPTKGISEAAPADRKLSIVLRVLGMSTAAGQSYSTLQS